MLDGVSNSIIAIPLCSTITAPTPGTTIFRGAPLNQPIMLTQGPLNGDLIATNQKDNNLVEITTGGRVVGTKTVDLPLST